MKKVIGISGSSRKNGNTAIIIGKVFDELNKEEIETELIQLSDYDIQPCKGCFACKGRGNCVFAKDGFAEIFSRMIEADGIILGSPVYSADVSAKMKAFQRPDFPYRLPADYLPQEIAPLYSGTQQKSIEVYNQRSGKFSGTHPIRRWIGNDC